MAKNLARHLHFGKSPSACALNRHVSGKGKGGGRDVDFLGLMTDCMVLCHRQLRRKLLKLKERGGGKLTNTWELK